MFLGGFFSQKDSFQKRFLNLEYSCHRRTRASSSDMTDMQKHCALLLSLQIPLLMLKHLGEQESRLVTVLNTIIR